MAKESKPELTLKLDPLEKFVRADDFGRAYATFLKAARSLGSQSTKLDWVVTELKIGSAVVSLQPVGDDAAGREAVQLGSETLYALESGEAPPHGVPDEFLDGIRELGELSEKKKLRATIANGRSGS